MWLNLIFISVGVAGWLLLQRRWSKSKNSHVCDPHATSATLSETLQKSMNPNLNFLSRAFATDVCRTLADLELNLLTNTNGRNRMLLGNNDQRIGLLSALKSACSALKNVAVVEVREFDTSICNRIARRLNIGRAWNEIEETMEEYPLVDRHREFDRLLAEQKRVFLIIDEAQNIYDVACDKRMRILQELSYIGNSTSGNIFCIIAGTDCLQRLAFDSSLNVDLNRTKFCPYFLSDE